jgi:hypothetical protein
MFIIDCIIFISSGNLLSVKFLREERYYERFPESRNKTVPMSLGASSSLQPPLGGQQNYSNSINIRSGGGFFEQVSTAQSGFSPGGGGPSAGRPRYSVGY